MEELTFDLQRALILLSTILKSFIGPIGRYILRLPPQTTFAGRIRLALEELGLTYLKLGQYLATRFDLLPVEVCRELDNLFENVSPMSFEEGKELVESELGGPLTKFFHSFNQEPIATASVAQVHEAQTHSNQRVAVKIRRPGVDRIFAADMRNFRRIATLIDVLGLLGTIPAREIVEEFSDWTLREMNFIVEGGTADRLRQSARPYEIVPKVYWELTTSQVLTMEFIEGVTLNQVASLADRGEGEVINAKLPNLDVNLVFHRLAFIVLHQLFVSGFFHADPHPGNVIVRTDNTVAFVDFGIFGELTEHQIEILKGTIENMAVGNIEWAFRYYSKLMIPTEKTDLSAFYQEGKSILSRLYQALLDPTTPIEERHLGRYSGEMFELVRRHRLRMSIDTLLFWRALNALDAATLRFASHVRLDLLGEMRGFFERIRPTPSERVLNLITDGDRAMVTTNLAMNMPVQSSAILSDLSQRLYRSPLYVYESPNMEQTKKKDIKLLIAGLLGTSITILASAPDWNWGVRAMMISITASLFIVSIIGTIRR